MRSSAHDADVEKTIMLLPCMNMMHDCDFLLYSFYMSLGSLLDDAGLLMDVVITDRQILR